MSSRAFSTALRHAKALNWRLNGTTQDPRLAQQSVEASVDQIPALAGKVDSAVINGNPHSTGDDPLHVSGAIGRGNLKGRNRVASFHAYPNGVVKFSKSSLPIIQVGTTGNAASGTASGTAAETTSGSGVSEAQTEYWTWSLDHDDYYHRDDDGSCVWYKASSNAASSIVTPRETEHNGGEESNEEGGKGSDKGK